LIRTTNGHNNSARPTPKPSSNTQKINQKQLQMYRAQCASSARIIGVAQTLLKPMKLNQTDHLETSDDAKIFKIVKGYNQI